MTRARKPAFVSALLAALLVTMMAPAATFAAGPKKSPDPSQVVSPTTPEGLSEGGVTVIDLAPDGSVIASSSREVGDVSSAETVALASASGCRSVDIYRSKYTLLGALAYRWHQTKYWCWSGGRVYGPAYSGDPAIGYYISDSDGWNVFQGISGTATYYYSWGGNSRGGHYSLRQAAMQNCIWAICLGTQYPYVKIWAHADGSYAWEVGG